MATRALGDSLFSVLPAELSATLFKHSRTVALASNQMLFLAGDPGDGCYRIDEGLVKISVVSSAGGERILAILGPGNLVGELSMIDGAARSASAVAIRETKLCFVSRAAFDAVATSHPEVYRHMAMLLTRRLRDIDNVVAATSFLSLKGRVARSLLNLGDAFGKEVGADRILIRQKINQSDLAAMAGMARENLSRILQDFTRRKLVSRLAGYYCLESKAGVEREAEL